MDFFVRSRYPRKQGALRTIHVATMLASLAATACFAQSGMAQSASDLAAPGLMAYSELPNAPGFSMAASSSSDAAAPSSAIPPTSATMPVASATQQVIEPGQQAPTLSAPQKLVYSVKESFVPFAIAGWFITAGYAQVTNGSPNYGTDRGAFGERLGAAAVRDTSEDILSDGVMSSIFHEDPRYYRLGPSHGVPARLLYAITRPLITRTDAGSMSPNLSNLTGTLAGDALSNLYYPASNRSATQTFKTFGGSIGADALVDFLHEFTADVTGMFHKHSN